MVVVVLILFLFSTSGLLSSSESLSSSSHQVYGIGEIDRHGRVTGAMGGTELMVEALKARLPGVLKRSVQISVSRVREVEKGKRRHILWLHDLPEDPESQHLKDKKSRDRFDVIVFVSEYQKRRYEKYFGVKFTNSVVLRNAIVPFSHKDIQKNKDGPLKLIYHTTPHRGLSILMLVFAELYKKYPKRIHLDVYSSFEIYGWKQRDKPFEALFDQCREHPGCKYHGFVSNKKIRGALREAHIFAYPSIWEETSCIAAIEAMSAGCEIVTSSLGALPETLGEYGIKYRHDSKDLEQNAIRFMNAMDVAIRTYWFHEAINRRRKMSLYAAREFGWGFPGWPEGRTEQWIRLLSSQISEFDVLPQRDEFNSDKKYSEALFVSGKRREMAGEIDKAVLIYEKSLQFRPRSSLLAVNLGIMEIRAGESMGHQELSLRGMKRLESVIEKGSSFRPLPRRRGGSIVRYGIAIRGVFWYSQRHYVNETRKSSHNAITSQYPHDDCWELHDVAYVPHVPLSEVEASEIVSTYHKRMNEMLRKSNLLCENLSAISGLFSLAYYDLEFRDELSKGISLMMKVFPSLVLTAPNLVQGGGGGGGGDNNSEELYQRSLSSITEENPVRIGFISSFFSRESSIWGNFGTTIRYLQKIPQFQVDMIYYPREKIEEQDKMLSINPDTNIYLSKFEASPYGKNLHDARLKIASRQYDILVYVDLYMTSELHHLALSKLAPIQIYTHGHPVTSGIPRDIMDYFLSWEVAELPEDPQRFYTESLIQIPSTNVPWEYFEPRTKDGMSLIVMKKFDHFDRMSLAMEILSHNKKAMKMFTNSNSNIYFCAQAVFKFHFTFDKILKQIQEEDSNAVIVLIELQGVLGNLHTRIVSRLSSSRLDMSRVVFVPRMRHDHLMAMYSLSDVVLDSVYFGGDTTSREAFETGAPIITLPHKTIGQRWTQAYYRMMGITEFIASNPDHYVKLAVSTATTNSQEIRKRIMKSAHEKLYHVESGVSHWVKTLMDIATRPRRFRWKDEALSGGHTEL